MTQKFQERAKGLTPLIFTGVMFLMIAVGNHFSYQKAWAAPADPCRWMYDKALASALKSDTLRSGTSRLSFTEYIDANAETSRTWSTLYIACKEASK